MRQPLKPLKSNEFAQNMALEKKHISSKFGWYFIRQSKTSRCEKNKTIGFLKTMCFTSFLFQVEMHSSSQGPCLYLTLTKLMKWT